MSAPTDVVEKRRFFGIALAGFGLVGLAVLAFVTAALVWIGWGLSESPVDWIFVLAFGGLIAVGVASASGGLMLVRRADRRATADGDGVDAG